MSAPDAAERLKRDVGALLDAGRTLAREYGGLGAAFWQLLQAELLLTRAALVRGTILLLLCALMVGTAWVVLMAMLVLGLHQAGASWQQSLLGCLLACLATAAVALVAARKALALARLAASRRQLAAWLPTTEQSPASEVPRLDADTESGRANGHPP